MMSMAIRVAMMVGLVACLTAVAHAIAGQATYYDTPYVPSACYGFRDSGVFIAAANSRLYGNRAACGRRYRVTCTGPANSVPHPCKGKGAVIVTLVDHCPGCNSDQIGLSRDAFSLIANPRAGRVNIDYTQV